MIKLIKNDTDIENIYTYFEFEKFYTWDGFDIIKDCLIEEGYNLKYSNDAIWSRWAFFEKGNMEFRLLFHEDFGNSLNNEKKMPDSYYFNLEKIGDIVVQKLNMKYFGV